MGPGNPAAQASATAITDDRLPEGWARASLRYIVAPSTERTEPSNPASRYLSLEHIESHTSRIIGSGKAADVQSTKTIFHAGDVLYGRLRPYLNKVCVPDFDGICSTDILVFPKSHWIESCFLMHFLMQPVVVEYANQNSNGIQLPRISFDKLRELELPLPPLAEQHRIVAKVEALLARVNAARQRLAKVSAILKRFRQSVLGAACSGRLTADWRLGQTESAQDLLQLVLVQREKAFFARSGNNRRKCPEPVALDERDLPEIPETWRWASADSVCSQVTDGEHIQPRYQVSGFPMLTATHVRDGYVQFKEVGLISESDFRKCLQRCAPSERDVLIVSVGATTGRSALVEKCPPFAIVRSVLLLRPLIVSGFLLRWTQSAWCFAWMTQASGASAQPHLYISDTKRMPVPVPPLAEQHEIVRRVEALFRLADAIEKRLAAATTRAEKLTQAVLAKAFRGELVPTAAELARREARDYEPASVLLERIQAERARSVEIRKTAKPRLRRGERD